MCVSLGRAEMGRLLSGSDSYGTLLVSPGLVALWTEWPFQNRESYDCHLRLMFEIVQVSRDSSLVRGIKPHSHVTI